MYSNNVKIVYLYTVCFITFIMTIGGLISTVNAVARLCLPIVHVPYSRIHDWQITQNHKEMSDEMLQLLIEKEEARIIEESISQAENERIRSIRSVINSCIVWIIAVPIFFVHKKKIISEENSQDGIS